MIRIKEGFTGERSVIVPPGIVDELKKDALTQSLYISYIGHYPKAQHHYRERPEGMEDYLFIYCMEGEGWYMTGSQRHKVKSGDFFILPAGESHCYGADEQYPWTIYWIHFNGMLAGDYAEGMDKPQRIIINDSSRQARWIELFEEMMHFLQGGFSLSNLHYITSELHFFMGMMRLMANTSAYGSRGISTEDNIIASAIHFMKENIEKKFNIKAVAEYTGYSTSHFAFLFKQKTGHAPKEYHNLLKIQHSCTLLDTTDLKINQICHKIGISDPFYFSRLFKQVMGISPKEYKNATR